ncbi:MAG: DUF350 domain-containing protein [Gemmatimonadetes bacterium]|nr:MAG: DUF350 domain-containing protein [Gemmatimonadota bacterium]
MNIIQNLLPDLIDLTPALDLYHPESVLYLVVVLVMFYLGKKVFDLTVPFNLNEQLTQEDNKAIATAFVGYMFGLGIIFWGVLTSEAARDVYWDLLDTAIWGGIGILLLNIARVINEQIILYQFDDVKELVEDRNVGTGAVACGAYIGAGLLVQGTIYGESMGYLQDIISVLIFFVLGEIFFVLYSVLYHRVVRFHLHDEIERDNVAAGVAFGMSFVAMGILLSGYMKFSYSLVGFALWFVLGTFLLLIFRYLIDKLILPGSLLDEEIRQDQNWGAALLEGGTAIAIALLMNAAFFS